MIEPYALHTRDSTIQVFPASSAFVSETNERRDDDIDLERVIWDAEYRNEVKRRLGTTAQLP